jgi:anti-sigma-K factor RskA
MTHDEIRSSLPALALGALDPAERAEVVAHVATCDECTAALAVEERVVQGIGLAELPVTPPAALKAKVMAKIGEAGSPFLGRNEAGSPFQSSHRERTPGFSFGVLPLAASLIIAAAAVFYAYSTRTELSALRASSAAGAQEAARLRQELVTLRRDWINLTRAMDVLKAPDMLRADLSGQAQAPGAIGRAFWSEKAGLLFAADRLPALPPGRVYQLWTITGKAATSAGIFTPDASGAVTVTAVVAAGAPRPDAFGVTIEPTGGSATPTMPIVLVGTSQNERGR